MIRFVFFSSVLALLLAPALGMAQQIQTPQEKESLLVVVEDIIGNRVEGYLPLDPKELTVSTKDKQEKSVPLKLIESIKVEKVQLGLPGVDPEGKESCYSVRLRNSQEIFTLSKKYTFSLNTSVGMVTRTIDPESIQQISRKDSSSGSGSKSDQPFIKDKSVVISLEVKF